MTTAIKDESGVTVRLEEDAWKAIQALSSSSGRGPDEILSDALALEQWVVDLRRQGRRLFVQDPGGTLHEVTVK